jgi:allantoinase
MTRDFVGYGPLPPHANWPGGARIAVNFVINFEEGSEPSWDADGFSEGGLTESASVDPGMAGRRDLGAESKFEYGSRVGWWRLYRTFTKYKIPVTLFACAKALEANPPAAEAIAATDWDICGHGYRWIKHFELDEAEERRQIAAAVALIKKTTGKPTLGWYCRYAPSENTRRIVAETNDVKFGRGVFGPGEDFFAYLRDAFDVLYDEGAARPRMLSIGLHMRIVGHPGRAKALMRFIEYIQAKDKVWICRREDIARHWIATHPAV